MVSRMLVKNAIESIHQMTNIQISLATRLQSNEAMKKSCITFDSIFENSGVPYEHAKNRAASTVSNVVSVIVGSFELVKRSVKQI